MASKRPGKPQTQPVAQSTPPPPTETQQRGVNRHQCNHLLLHLVLRLLSRNNDGGWHLRKRREASVGDHNGVAARKFMLATDGHFDPVSVPYARYCMFHNHAVCITHMSLPAVAELVCANDSHDNLHNTSPAT